MNIANITAVIAASIILLAFLKPRVILELAEKLSGLGILGWNSSASRLHGYDNLCLTTQPYGFPAMQNMDKYWMDRPKNWAIEYSEKRVRGDIDTVRSSTPLLLSEPAPAHSHSIALEYYHNPIEYCKKYPNRYPCPNYWISPEEKTDFKGNKNYASDDMYVPGLLEGNFGHVRDRDIDDNYHTRIVEPDREDHALC